MPQITIRPNDSTRTDKLADADVRFTQDDGPILAGLILTGFSIWPSKYDSSARVQIPTRQYYQGRELRKYAILRNTSDQPLEQDHPLIAVILAEYERTTAPAPQPLKPPAPWTPPPVWTPAPGTTPAPVSLYDIARAQDRARHQDAQPAQATPATVLPFAPPQAPRVDPAPPQDDQPAPRVPATVLPFARRYTPPAPSARTTNGPKPPTTPAGRLIRF